MVSTPHCRLLARHFHQGSLQILGPEASGAEETRIHLEPLGFALATRARPRDRADGRAFEGGWSATGGANGDQVRVREACGRALVVVLLCPPVSQARDHDVPSGFWIMCTQGRRLGWRPAARAPRAPRCKPTSGVNEIRRPRAGRVAFRLQHLSGCSPSRLRTHPRGAVSRPRCALTSQPCRGRISTCTRTPTFRSGEARLRTCEGDWASVCLVGAGRRHHFRLLCCNRKRSPPNSKVALLFVRRTSCAALPASPRARPCGAVARADRAHMGQPCRGHVETSTRNASPRQAEPPCIAPGRALASHARGGVAAEFDGASELKSRGQET